MLDFEGMFPKDQRKLRALRAFFSDSVLAPSSTFWRTAGITGFESTTSQLEG